MSQYNIPWSPGYAIPEYVQAEPPGRGTFTTAYLPRRTISQLVPDFLLQQEPGGAVAIAQRAPMGAVDPVRRPTKWGAKCGTPGQPRCGPQQGGVGNYIEVGADDIDPTRLPAPGFPGDPIVGYGREVAHKLIASLRMVPQKDRQTALHALLDKIDPALWSKVESSYGANGRFESALAKALADGFAREVVNIGLTGRLPQRGQVAVGCYGPQAISGLWDTITGAVSTVGSYAKQGAQIVGSAACKALKSPAAGIAAGAAGASLGVPPQAGAAGAQMAGAAACGSGSSSAPIPRGPSSTDHRVQQAIPAPGYQQPMYMPPPPAASSFPIIPVAIGGAALLAAVILLRK